MEKDSEILVIAKARRRVFDQMASMHFLLCDKHNRWAIIEDVVEICLSVLLCAFTFFDFSMVIKGQSSYPVIAIGTTSVLLFAFTLIKQRVDRKKKSENHLLAGKQYSRAKIDLTNHINRWEACGYSENEVSAYLENNFCGLNDLIQIPEASFAKLKHTHQKKVEFSRYLDDHKEEPFVVCKLKFLIKKGR